MPIALFYLALQKLSNNIVILLLATNSIQIIISTVLSMSRGYII